MPQPRKKNTLALSGLATLAETDRAVIKMALSNAEAALGQALRVAYQATIVQRSPISEGSCDAPLVTYIRDLERMVYCLRAEMEE